MARRAGWVLVAISLVLTALGAAGSTAAAAATAPTTATPPPPQAWIVVDAKTGEILLAHAEHQALPPASLAKLMTALTAVERLSPSAHITVSARAAGQPASKIGMLAGQRWTLSDTLASLMVVSANDAAYALAEATSGSVASFAKAEAKTAQGLGLRDSTFADPAGLDDGNAYQGGPRMSAYDIAISACDALRVPAIARLAAAPSVAFVGPDGVHHTLTNHNKLVSEHLYAGANGLKTGFTNKAGHTFVASATRNGRTLVAVMLNTWDTYGWAQRFLDVAFATPPGKGIGSSIPCTTISTYSAREAQFSAFRQLAAAPVPARTNVSSPSTSPSTSPSSTAATAAAPASGASHAANLAASATSAKERSSHGPSTLTLVIVFLVLVLVALYVLRVRAVRRRRLQRLARRREARQMMRRGSLPVVDGRYRTGIRTGKPVESHVQVRREDAGGADDPRAFGSG